MKEKQINLHKKYSTQGSKEDSKKKKSKKIFVSKNRIKFDRQEDEGGRRKYMKIVKKSIRKYTKEEYTRILRESALKYDEFLRKYGMEEEMTTASRNDKRRERIEIKRRFPKIVNPMRDFVIIKFRKSHIMQLMKGINHEISKLR